ncbi:hypothetical protein [Leptospira adleri]|uniref:hypothetical protein n=1 Tax=Leptospira adleri TaxID=2023186 RepID=UPI001083AA46|nr:hypothetical protein [Leptospira adleri]TGM58598.1 hypothetical protein EHQ97_05730 [Leptospira adleri]
MNKIIRILLFIFIPFLFFCKKEEGSVLREILEDHLDEFLSQGNLLKEAHISLISKFKVKTEDYEIVHLELGNDSETNAEFERWNYVVFVKNRVVIFRDSSTRRREILFEDLTGDTIPEAILFTDIAGNHATISNIKMIDFSSGSPVILFQEPWESFSMDRYFTFSRELAILSEGFRIESTIDVPACLFEYFNSAAFRNRFAPRFKESVTYSFRDGKLNAKPNSVFKAKVSELDRFLNSFEKELSEKCICMKTYCKTD